MNKKIIGIIMLILGSILIDKAIQGNLVRIKKIMNENELNHKGY